MARKKKVTPFAGKETPAEEAAEHKVMEATARKAMRGHKRHHKRAAHRD